MTIEKTSKIRVSDLVDRNLDYHTALALGWVWAKNASKRYGDSGSYHSTGEGTRGYIGGRFPKWPVGARCVIPPNKAKNLHETEKNWDGWLKCDMLENIAPAALDQVPYFSKRLSEISEYVEKIGIGFTVNHDPNCPSEFKITAFHPGVHFGYQGPTYAVAACRAIVGAAFGDEVDR